MTIQRTNYDVALAVAIKDAEREVIEAAEKWANAYENELGAGLAMTTDAERKRTAERSGNAIMAMYHAVRRLREVRNRA